MNKKSNHLAELFIDVIPKSMQLIREEMREGRGERLSVPQFRVLAAINRGLCSNKEIGERLGVSEAAISRMIDLLVNDGLIRKEISKTDRRQTHLSLSIDGRKFFDSVKREAQKRLKNKLEIINSEDMETIIRGFEALSRNLSLISGE